MTDSTPGSSPRRHRSHGGSLFVLLFILALLAVLGWRGWAWWQARLVQDSSQAQQQAQLTNALQSRIDALRDNQRTQAQRIAQADATNRVLRDEIMGIGQRSALIEESVEKLADPARSGAQALRLDEVELLLAMGMQRLQVAGDLAGARHAYVLADGVLAGIDDPAWLDLRQVLAQEREALAALGADPKVLAMARLDAFARTLTPSATRATPERDASLPWWRRALARVVQVRPADSAVAVAPDDRAAGYAALQLEITLARAALERRDEAAWRSALGRADNWLTMLWPDSPSLRTQREQLQALRELPLSPDVPGLGSTLQQLRLQRAAR